MAGWDMQNPHSPPPTVITNPTMAPEEDKVVPVPESQFPKEECEALRFPSSLPSLIILQPSFWPSTTPPPQPLLLIQQRPQRKTPCPSSRRRNVSGSA